MKCVFFSYTSKSAASLVLSQKNCSLNGEQPPHSPEKLAVLASNMSERSGDLLPAGTRANKAALCIMLCSLFASEEIWAAINIEISRTGEGEARLVWSSAGIQRLGKREIPEKTRRPASSSGKIPACENLGATPPGIEPSSPWWSPMGESLEWRVTEVIGCQDLPDANAPRVNDTRPGTPALLPTGAHKLIQPLAWYLANFPVRTARIEIAYLNRLPSGDFDARVEELTPRCSLEQLRQLFMAAFDRMPSDLSLPHWSAIRHLRLIDFPHSKLDERSSLCALSATPSRLYRAGEEEGSMPLQNNTGFVALSYSPPKSDWVVLRFQRKEGFVLVFADTTKDEGFNRRSLDDRRNRTFVCARHLDMFLQLRYCLGSSRRVRGDTKRGRACLNSARNLGNPVRLSQRVGSLSLSTARNLSLEVCSTRQTSSLTSPRYKKPEPKNKEDQRAKVYYNPRPEIQQAETSAINGALGLYPSKAGLNKETTKHVIHGVILEKFDWRNYEENASRLYTREPHIVRAGCRSNVRPRGRGEGNIVYIQSKTHTRCRIRGEFPSRQTERLRWSTGHARRSRNTGAVIRPPPLTFPLVGGGGGSHEEGTGVGGKVPGVAASARADGSRTKSTVARTCVCLRN
ncbi:hypothetical protein PR048_027139 [Dryococelus australis]|uniref:Uncharacterized protein n=1 Tax=Dryococelus australis TaxID=614101 RepID=A0ABQ9GGI6_9NEOP|nr:hypothetical protein PR048_027139 [Dryococelus australis]